MADFPPAMEFLKARWGRLPALALILALTLGGWAGCNLGEQRALPPKLLGTWITHAPRYRGRSLEVHATLVVLADRGRPIDRYHVQGVASWNSPQGEIYQLRCLTDDGLKDALRLTYMAGRPPRVLVGEAPAMWVPRRKR